MNYTLHQLRVFLKVVELESISKAANELHLTQPAVSIQMKKFQEQFDIPLTEIIKRRLYVTRFGEEVAVTCRKVLEEAEELRNKSMAYRGLLAGELSFSVASTGKYVMPSFLSDFMEKHPSLDLKMDVTNKSRVVESLRRNEVDFALVSVLPEEIETERIRLMENRLYLCRKVNTENIPERISGKDLENHPLIFREKGSATRQAMENYIASLNIRYRKSMELTSNEAVKQAVLAGLGYSVMPLIGMKNELQNGDIEIVPMEGLPVTTHWNITWLKGKQLSPAARAFVRFMQKEKENIIREKFQWYEWY